MAKNSTCFVIALFLLISVAQAVRKEPTVQRESQVEVVEKANKENKLDEGCEGVGEDECLMRRTLAAHIDYIYTQEEHH